MQKMKKDILKLGKKYYRKILLSYDVFRSNLELNKTEEIDVDISTDIDDFIVTTGTGVYLFRDGKLIKLLNGEFFGITKHKEVFYVYQKMKYSGRVLSFVLNKHKAESINVFINEFPRNAHQIDFIGDNLFITDTQNNRIAVYNEDGIEIKEIFPFGKLKNGRKSENYGHFNSVYYDGSYIVVLAHNYSQHTKKMSELVFLNKETYDVEKYLKNIGMSSHNILKLDSEFLTCDSYNGALKLGEKVVFKTDKFTRGIAYNNKNFLIGGSMYGKRAERLGKDGFIYVLDNRFKLLDTIVLEGRGPVFDIRYVEFDAGMSGNMK